MWPGQGPMSSRGCGHPTGINGATEAQPSRSANELQGVWPRSCIPQLRAPLGGGDHGAGVGPWGWGPRGPCWGGSADPSGAQGDPKGGGSPVTAWAGGHPCPSPAGGEPSTAPPGWAASGSGSSVPVPARDRGRGSWGDIRDRAAPRAAHSGLQVTTKNWASSRPGPNPPPFSEEFWDEEAPVGQGGDQPPPGPQPSRPSRAAPAPVSGGSGGQVWDGGPSEGSRPRPRCRPSSQAWLQRQSGLRGPRVPGHAPQGGFQKGSGCG